MQTEDYRYSYIDGLPLVKELYSSFVNPEIVSLHFCQNDEDVWIEVSYQKKTCVGIMVTSERTNLNFIAEPSLFEYDNNPSYLPENSIVENADRFFHDIDTIINTTDILICSDNDEADNEDVEVDDEDDQCRILPEELDDFQTIKQFIQNILSWYVHESNTEKSQAYENYVNNALAKFAAGQGQDDYSFSLFLEQGDEELWISVNAEENLIELSEGGHTYSPDVGGDTYTTWMFTIWNSGEIDGDLDLNFGTVSEMIHLGAMLQIESPDDFIEDDEDD